MRWQASALRLWWFASVAVLTHQQPSAKAQELETSNACVNEIAAFEGALRSRLPHGGAPAFVVRAMRRDGKVVGILAEQRRPEQVLRTVEAGNCAAVVDALALIAALLVEQESTAASRSAPRGTPPAERDKRAQPTAPTSTESPPAAAEQAPADTYSGTAAIPSTSLATAEQRRGETPVQSTTSASETKSQLRVWAAALLMGGSTPGLGYGFGVGASYARRLRGPAEFQLRAGGRFSPRQDVESRDGRIEMWMNGAFLSACVARLRETNKLALGSCASLEAGRLQARGVDTRSPRHDSRAWIAAGPSLFAALQLGRVLLTLQIDGLLPFAHHRYVLADTTVHSVPWLAVRGEFALAFTWP